MSQLNLYWYFAGTLASLFFCPPECYMEERTVILFIIEPSEVFRGRFLVLIKSCLVLDKSFIFLGSKVRIVS